MLCWLSSCWLVQEKFWKALSRVSANVLRAIHTTAFRNTPQNDLQSCLDLQMGIYVFDNNRMSNASYKKPQLPEPARGQLDNKKITHDFLIWLSISQQFDKKQAHTITITQHTDKKQSRTLPSIFTQLCYPVFQLKRMYQTCLVFICNVKVLE